MVQTIAQRMLSAQQPYSSSLEIVRGGGGWLCVCGGGGVVCAVGEGSVVCS